MAVNPWTSLDVVCGMALFNCSHNDSGQGSVSQLRSSSLDCRPVWKSFFTLADCYLLSIIFLIKSPFFCFGLMWCLHWLQIRWWSM